MAQAKYREVDHLPDKALPVRCYAEKMGFTKQYVYKLLRLKREGKKDNLDFEIVLWARHNYIIPKKQK